MKGYLGNRASGLFMLLFCFVFERVNGKGQQFTVNRSTLGHVAYNYHANIQYWTGIKIESTL